MNWRRLLIDGPAKIFDVWLLAYRTLMALLVLGAMLSVTAMLVLWFGLGIRWGW